MHSSLERILREIDARQSAQARRARVRPPKWGEQGGGAVGRSYAALMADSAAVRGRMPPGALQWPPPRNGGWSAAPAGGLSGGGSELQARVAAIQAGMAALEQSRTPEGGATWLRSLPGGYGLARAKAKLRQRSGGHPSSEKATRYARTAMYSLSAGELWRLATLGEKLSNVMPLLPVGALVDLLFGRPVLEATAGVPDEQGAARLRALHARSEAAIAERHR